MTTGGGDRVEAVVPAADRGVTRIAERVVAKLAVQAAREALRAGAQAPPPPGRGDGGPQATAEITRDADGGPGGLARIRVAIELGYPSDIGAQCRAVRRHVALRVGELAGMETATVAVSVERLHSVHADTPGRVV